MFSVIMVIRIFGAKNVIYTIGFSPIIGQRLCFPLALFNAPGFLPEGLNRFLFEPQWTLWIVMALVIIVLAVVAWRGREKLRSVALGLAAVLVVWIAMAYLVDTRYERLYASCRRLLDATIQQNTEGVLAELDDGFTFGDITKSTLAAPLKAGLPALSITRHSIQLFETTSGDPDTIVHINIWSTFGKEGSIPTRWELLYQLEPDGSFKLHSVTGWKIGETDQKLAFPDIPGM